MENCYTGVTMETPIEAPCGGEFISTACIVETNAISYLNLPAGATQSQINAALINALLYKDQQILNLQTQIDELQTQIDELQTQINNLP